MLMYSTIDEAWGNEKDNDVETEKSSKKTETDTEALSLANITDTPTLDISDRYTRRSRQRLSRSRSRSKRPKYKYQDDSFSEYDDTETLSVPKSKKINCGECYDGIRNLIDNKLDRLVNDFVLETKLKQISAANNPNPLAIPTVEQFSSNNSTNNNSIQWKDLALIALCFIIVLLILFLIFKTR